MPDLHWWQWALGIAAAFFTGVAKTGVPGLGILVVPLMIFTVGDARFSSAWLLPIMCTADVAALYYWRRHAAISRLLTLAPWVLAGGAAGALALSLPERIVRPMVRSIVALMLCAYLWRRRRTRSDPAAMPAAPFGIAAGFASTVANAAGPVMNIYLLSKRLPKEEFVATGAWFFFLLNLSKVPLYAWYGLFSAKSLSFDLWMLPSVLAGSITGRWIIERIPLAAFEILIVVLTGISTALLFR